MNILEKKKRKQANTGYLAFTTGFPEHDDKMFNQAIGSDIKPEETKTPEIDGALTDIEAPATSGEGGGSVGEGAGEAAGGEGAGMSESMLTESSWIFEESEFEDGYFLECRWDKYAGFEVLGGWIGEDGIVHDDFHRSYSTKENAMNAYRRFCKQHGNPIKTNVNEALLEAHIDPADYWDEDPEWYDNIPAGTKSADWDMIRKARAQAHKQGYTTYGKASKAAYFGNSDNYKSMADATDEAAAKELYKSNLKSNKLDVRNFHRAYDGILENAGYLNLFNKDGILKNKGTYGVIKDIKDFHVKNILLGFWRAQFNGSEILYGTLAQAEAPKEEVFDKLHIYGYLKDYGADIGDIPSLVAGYSKAGTGVRSEDLTDLGEADAADIADKALEYSKIHGPQLSSPADSVADAVKEYNEKHQVNESLTEETKRYVKRYYIRPQNIFCSNKTEILKALVDLGEENCSVYSLKELSDHDDVHLLKPSDIIYYYDDGIIYDKNHVKVMDYDLSPKHEEERKKQDVNAVSDAAFAANYENRLTDVDLKDTDIKVRESVALSSTNPFDEEWDSFNAYGEKLVEGVEDGGICCICGEEIDGYGNNAEPYKSGRCCDACNVKFVIPARLAEFNKYRQEKDED